MEEQRQKIYEILVDTVRESVKIEGEILPQMRFKEDLGVDSVAMMHLYLLAEEKLDIELYSENSDFDDLQTAHTLEGMVDVLEKHLLKKV